MLFAFARLGRNRVLTAALAFKLACGFGVGALYAFHYGSGDTLDYYRATRFVVETFAKNPADGLQLYFGLPAQNAALILRYTSDEVLYNFLIDRKATALVRVCVPFYALTGGSYFGISAFLSGLCFGGLFLAYRVLFALFPDLRAQLTAALFFLPSAVFWSAGILKETIAVAAMGTLIYLINFFLQKDLQAKNSANSLRFYNKIAFGVVSFVTALVLYELKPYLLLAFSPFVVLWIMGEKGALRDRRGKWLAAAAAAGVLVFFNVTDYHWRFIWEQIHGVRHALETRPAFDGAPPELLTPLKEEKLWTFFVYAPYAIFSVLYRPMWTDVQNPLYWPAVVENTASAALSLYLILRIKKSSVRKNPILWITLVFPLAYAYFLGITVPILGTLLRYRAVITPLWWAGLAIAARRSDGKNED